jgi:hypothetical protein
VYLPWLHERADQHHPEQNEREVASGEFYSGERHSFTLHGSDGIKQTAEKTMCTWLQLALGATPPLPLSYLVKLLLVNR